MSSLPGMPSRARSLAELEREIAGGGMDEGASAPSSPRSYRLDDLTVDDSRVRQGQRLLEETIHPRVARGPIQSIDVETGVVDTRWGPVQLAPEDRSKVAALVVAAVRRSWDSELQALVAGPLAVTLTPDVPLKRDGTPYKKRVVGPRRKEVAGGNEPQANGE